MKHQSFPLGIDLGTTGIRIAEIVGPEPLVRNIVTKTLPPQASEQHIIQTLEFLLKQLQTKERRCIITCDDRHAIVRELSLPPMARHERLQAARIETQRLRNTDQPSSVRLERLAENRFVLGSIFDSAIERLQRIMRKTKLRLLAVDHASYAFRRIHQPCDAILDIGFEQTRFYGFTAQVPFTQSLDIAGNSFTQAIATLFAIDQESAESRKRLHGIAPAGDGEIAAIVQFVGRAIRAARASGSGEIERILLTGNGARLPMLPLRLERDTGCLVEIATRFHGCQIAFADDLVRTAAPEWALACGAALWSFAENPGT